MAGCGAIGDARCTYEQPVRATLDPRERPASAEHRSCGDQSADISLTATVVAPPARSPDP